MSKLFESDQCLNCLANPLGKYGDGKDFCPFILPHANGVLQESRDSGHKHGRTEEPRFEVLVRLRTQYVSNEKTRRQTSGKGHQHLL